MRQKIRSRRARDGRAEANRMARMVDNLAAFEEFKRDVLPAIRADIKKGLTTPQLRAKYQSLLTARAITIGLTDPDSGKAMSAIRDLQDREEGKPKERKDITHHLKDVPEEQLDAIIATKLSERSGPVVFREAVSGEEGYGGEAVSSGAVDAADAVFDSDTVDEDEGGNA